YRDWSSDVCSPICSPAADGSLVNPFVKISFFLLQWQNHGFHRPLDFIENRGVSRYGGQLAFEVFLILHTECKPGAGFSNLFVQTSYVGGNYRHVRRERFMQCKGIALITQRWNNHHID